MPAARGTLIALSVVGAALCSACGPTVFDASVVSTTAPSTTTTLPSGTAATLLPVMLDEVFTLGRKVEAAAGDSAAATVIEQLWEAVRDEIAAARPELLEDFEFVVTRCRLAADRNRPADADRAYKNLRVLVDAFLGS